MSYAPGAVSVNPVIVIGCPDVMLVVIRVISPPPPVAVIVPCIWQVVPSLA
jgi:hypothetical protein